MLKYSLRSGVTAAFQCRTFLLFVDERSLLHSGCCVGPHARSGRATFERGTSKQFEEFSLNGFYTTDVHFFLEVSALVFNVRSLSPENSSDFFVARFSYGERHCALMILNCCYCAVLMFVPGAYSSYNYCLLTTGLHVIFLCI